MINYYHKVLLTLVACVVLLPMLLLVLVSTCDFTIPADGDWWHAAVRRVAVATIVVWIFNLMLLILTLAMKELLIGHFCFVVDNDHDPIESLAMQQNFAVDSSSASSTNNDAVHGG